MSEPTHDAADDAADTALLAALGAAPPPGVAALPGEVQVDLAEKVQAARRHQVAQIERALDESLRLVPRPLRGVVRKVVMR